MKKQKALCIFFIVTFVSVVFGYDNEFWDNDIDYWIGTGYYNEDYVTVDETEEEYNYQFYLDFTALHVQVRISGSGMEEYVRDFYGVDEGGDSRIELGIED